MKKCLAILFAVIFTFSCFATVMASAVDTAIVATEGSYVCDYCGAKFYSQADLNSHLADAFPVKDHSVECEYCTKTFTSKTAYQRHLEGDSSIGLVGCKDSTDRKIPCKYADNGCEETFATKAEYTAHLDVCNFRSLSAMFEGGEYIAAIKYIIATIKDFIASDTFQTIVSVIKKVIDVVKGIDLSGVISTVKGIAEKIPFDTIVAKVQELAGSASTTTAA